MKHFSDTFQTKLLGLFALSGFVTLTGLMSVTNPLSVYGYPITPPSTKPVDPSPSPTLPITSPVNPSPSPTPTLIPSPIPTVVPTPTLMPSPYPTFVPSPSPSIKPTVKPSPTPTPPVVNVSVPKLKTQQLVTGKQGKLYQTKIVITAPKNVNFSVYTLGLPHGLVQSPVTYKKTANKSKAVFYINGISRQSGNFNVVFYMTGQFGTVSESRTLIIKPETNPKLPISQKPGFSRYL